MKRITPEQHSRAVMRNRLRPGADRPYAKEFDTFAKPGETQEAAIKRWVAARKRLANKPEPRVFPNNAEALTSTRAYVEAYYRMNNLVRLTPVPDYVRSLFGELSTTPTTWPETDEIVVEQIEEGEVE